MTRIAITGHRDLYDITAEAVERELRECLATVAAAGPLVGVSCLADGADAMFAAAVVGSGGKLVAIIPAAEYRVGLPAEYWPEYDRLLTAAANVVHLGHTESTDQSYMDASVAMLDGADQLIAVWDEQPARGYGGTADVVDYARDRGIDVTLVWPEGAKRGR